jgi:hypothetical protein
MFKLLEQSAYALPKDDRRVGFLLRMAYEAEGVPYTGPTYKLRGLGEAF